MSESERIVVNPKVCLGKPVIKGTRLKVEFILELLASGWTHEQIQEEYDLKDKDILAVLEYARRV